ncbi:hypothetical protein HYPSUDRAFT_47130 [Hypholoma sublateritium FD-334 SS-4]|uniref:Phosphoglycerate mutase-like protein n=1 Tax=Hypholoma sublateritium (strain FD-334 SS-4) TaxID=945553 RepID=A0A0D2P8J6_HYPSF|nr:hypothetical protein HYPSUDRAFT_47130 [Hypholoma sublateritium FD-334 SS-4]
MRPGRKHSLLSTHYALLVAFLSVKAIYAENILQEEASPSCYAGDIVGAGELGTQCETNMIMGTSKQEPGLAGISAYSQIRLNADEYPPAPANLELEQVHVYVRHGERTPVGVRLAGPPASIPEHWNMCRTARKFRAAVSSAFDPGSTREPGDKETISTRKLVERRDGSRVEGECLLGELTDLGRQSTYNFGRNLRKIYIDKLGFIPDVLSNNDQVYFRSTNIPRTTESLQQIIHGLYPTTKCDSSVQPPLLVRNGKDENLIGNTYVCKRLELLQVGFAMAAAQAFNRSLEPLDSKISKYLNGNPIRVDGKPRASGVMDTIRAAVAHGVKVPPEFEDKSIVDTIEQAVVSEWFADKTEEVRRLGMGPLLSDMTRKMQDKIKHKAADPLKVLVHSTHDTAIAALASTFDVFDENWPAFTASITFELFKQRATQSPSKFSQNILSRISSDPSADYYIRMRHQNKNVVLPLCAPEGSHLAGHPEICTFSAFKARVAELTPTDWDAECSSPGRA